MNTGLIIMYAGGSLLVLGASIIAYWVFRREAIPRVCFRFSVLLIVASVYLLFAHYLKYRSLHFYVDFASWPHLLYNITLTGKPLSFNEMLIHSVSMNYFASHFVPLVYILALPFKLWPFNETLIVMNFILMLSAAIPLYKLAVNQEHDHHFGLFMAALLLWYPTFQYTVLYEFDMLRLSMPIIFWMLYFWQKKRIFFYFIFVMLAILVREEVGLTIMMFGLYVLFIENKRMLGFLTTILGCGGFILIAQVLMPMVRGAGHEHISMLWFSAFGQTPVEIAKTMITHPRLVIMTVFQPEKVVNIFMYFLPLLFIPLFAPAILISTIANVGIGLLSCSITAVSYMLYYLSPSIPFIFYAFIKGWPTFIEKLRSVRFQLPFQAAAKSAAMLSVLCGLVVSNIFFGPSFLSLQFWSKQVRPAPFKTQNFHFSAYRITEHSRKAEELSKLIPDSAVVSADYFLFPLLFKKKGTMIFPYLERLNGTVKADYAFFDKTNNGLRQESTAYKTQVDFDKVEKDPQMWQLIKSENGFFLYKRKI